MLHKQVNGMRLIFPSPALSVFFSLFSLRSPGTWASLVPFQVSNGTPILPTNVHQNYSINIIGEPLVPAETGNWTHRGRMTPRVDGCWWCRASTTGVRSHGWNQQSSTSCTIAPSPSATHTNTHTPNPPSMSLPTPRPSLWRTLAVKWRRGLV